MPQDDRPLKVLHVLTPGRYSGAERAAVHLMLGLRELGHDVRVILKPNADMERALGEHGLPFQAASISGKLNFAAPGRLRRAAEEFAADLLHTHLSTASMWGGVAGWLWGLPVVSAVQALNTKHCFCLAHKMIACSRGVKQHLLDQGVSRERISVVYNSLDLQSLRAVPSAAEARREAGVPADAPTVGVLAHLSCKKGHAVLLDAVGRLSDELPDLHCLFVGEGPEQEALGRKAAALGLRDRVIFTGYVQEGYRLIPAMDVVALPSIAKEGLPLCLAEAAFLGKPTLGSPLPGVAEAILDGETGLLAEMADPASWAEQLRRLLADEGLRTRLGEAGHRRAAAEFDHREAARRTVAIYREVLAGHAGARGASSEQDGAA